MQEGSTVRWSGLGQGCCNLLAVAIGVENSQPFKRSVASGGFVARGEDKSRPKPDGRVSPKQTLKTGPSRPVTLCLDRMPSDIERSRGGQFRKRASSVLIRTPAGRRLANDSAENIGKVSLTDEAECQCNLRDRLLTVGFQPP